MRFLILFALVLLPSLVRAEEFGLFTYEVITGSEVKITGYPEEAVGPVDIPATIDSMPVTVVGEYAFRSCNSVTSIEIPASVTTVESRAFHNCDGLTDFTIPSTVTLFDPFAFTSCNNLTAINVEAGNPNYSSLNGVLFNSGQTSILRCPSAASGTFIIPESVTHVSSSAFHSCENLSAIRIPSQVNDLSTLNVTACDQLVSLEVAPGHTSFKSINGVLYTSSEDAIIKFPPGREGFYTVPPSATMVADSAFRACDGLTEVLLPDGLKTIGDSAFADCSSLVRINFPSTLTALGADAFAWCSKLRSARLPDGLNVIGSGCFENCTALEHIDLSEGLTVIRSDTFTRCDALTVVVIPSTVTELEGAAFRYCDDLATVAFLGDAPTISYTTFRGVSGLSLYYLEGASGYDTSEWASAEPLDLDRYPAALWLLNASLAPDTDLNTDHNGDGASLLMSYALDLDPRNPQPGMPQPTLSAGALSISFHASTPGVQYRVLGSADLKSWNAIGIQLSPLQADGSKTASITANTPSRFLRLSVRMVPNP